ncbi:hypothetical protein Poli38472_007749 [Pythium oligandrum]|uniref:Glutathione S-transferase n=1 Tax=Pythium oligandrum TaxID=41045 RepID=A0A8K1CQR4_PYTOL|nr:hypothetical protein Poli38472_007749 [Pythium oligandrum]|eukprot:TMW68077.1 hypothetical protein Poli38472_007749 [Pythium oligandrum]
MPLKLYANFISQPSRAVAWLLAVKNVDYELVRMDFGSPLFKSEEFLAMNPNGFIPVIKDEDFTLFESNAILTYLADKYGWEDVYPKDLQTRAKINEYLHWHHTTVREFTNRILDPFISKALGSASDEDREHVKNAPKLIAKYTSILEKFFATDLDFVARTSEPSVADYALYCEYDQLDSMGLLNLAAFPKTTAWLERMKKVSKHDELREEMNGAFGKRGIYAHV